MLEIKVRLSQNMVKISAPKNYDLMKLQGT